ncbi:MAG: aminodeoxychorismate synthase component I [Hyphomicrobiaceae bacterium]|nr:aminodeoxychorismate synthase component I [Hyphomicrobiaceae bacterium]
MTASVLIHDARSRPGRAQLYVKPHRIIQACEPGDVSGALSELNRAHETGAHLAGFLSFEAGYALEPRFRELMPEERQVPLVWFAVFDEARELSAAETDEWLSEGDASEYRLPPPKLSMDAADYCRRFDKVKNYISAGDIYQLNLTLKGHFQFDGNPRALYRDLQHKQPVSHAAMIQTPEFTVVSASPELFLKMKDRRAQTRPMKGTAARGLTLDEDRGIANWLASDEKSRAENLMIVDLMRNDLGRIAEIGSVRVSDLYTVETYETLHQMTSGVEANVSADTNIASVLEKMFPPGSITGAPKVRAIEIIRELETEPRGIYTGAIGSISPDGTTHFNVAIRTLTLFADGRGEVGIGSGVVHDSQAQAEYEECILKMRFLTDPVRDFQLIETMLHDPVDGYLLLDRHLDRLAESAAFFRYPCEIEAIRQALEAHSRTLSEAPYRVRLLLFRDGRTEITETELPSDAPATQMRYVISKHTTLSTDVFLYHKTTERQLYDGEWARMHDLYGADEVVFLNERGEVTEGSRTNVFALIDGELLTPPLRSGVLPGTFRLDFLEAGKAREAVLTEDDLNRAEEVFLGNSVRGLMPARELLTSEAKTAVS